MLNFWDSWGNLGIFGASFAKKTHCLLNFGMCEINEIEHTIVPKRILVLKSHYKWSQILLAMSKHFRKKNIFF